MDGNGRWAERAGLTRSEGHKAGTEAAKAVVTACRRLGIAHLTLYTFSKENWSRPQDEVRVLFSLLRDYLTRELPTLLQEDIRLRILGEMDDIPFAARQVLKATMAKTAKCSTMTLNLALNYSGRGELVRAMQAMAKEGFAPGEVTEEALAERLYTAGQPDPDLVIRTSGELRLSNFLLFQSAYAELHFTDVLWPDFGEEDLRKALDDYAHRKRRFGGIEPREAT
jgi:undecaprenyl diphosphate synthase